MFLVVVYDIPSDISGTIRRKKIHKICQKYGFHVQNSVFELDITYSDLLKVKHDIEKVLDIETDSVRLYVLGKERTDTNVILLGKREVCESNDSCFIL